MYVLVRVPPRVHACALACVCAFHQCKRADIGEWHDKAEDKMDDYLEGFELGCRCAAAPLGSELQNTILNHVEVCADEQMRAGFDDALAFTSFLFARAIA